MTGTRKTSGSERRPAFAPEGVCGVKIPVLCLLGPTGSGKTGLTTSIAGEWQNLMPSLDGCVIINADSRQVYRDFPIITAQPGRAEIESCPHRMYGFLNTSEKFCAGTFARMAREAILLAIGENRLPVLVGGTGLYFRSLLSGIAPIPKIPQGVTDFWLERLREEGPEAMHLLLSSYDKDYAAVIHPRDSQRIVRALSVWQSTGHTFSWWHSQPLPESPYEPVMLGISLPMDELEPRLHKRILQMLEEGALHEAEKALALCPDPEAPGWSGIGCAELRGHLEGRLGLDECVNLWFKNTRAYAKRQKTWFNKEPKEAVWLRPDQENEALAYLRDQLNRLEYVRILKIR